MILHISPTAPLIVRLAADAALVLHIGGGGVGLVSGAVAMAARKGGALHRAAGNVFFVAMLFMSGVGAIVAPMLLDRASAVAGLFTFYLTVTAWATVKRPAGRVGHLEPAALLFLAAAAAGALWLVWIGAHSPKGLIDGKQPFQMLVVFLALMAIAGAGDLHLLRAGGLAGKPRMARHIWRMSLALFVASGSFFLGQQKVMPAFMRGSPLLFIPALAPLPLMAYWLVRNRFGRRRARRAPVRHRPPAVATRAVT